jgi:hypothetical protein
MHALNSDLTECYINTTIIRSKPNSPTFLIREGCRGINLQENDVEKAFAEMRDAGVQIL